MLCATFNHRHKQFYFFSDQKYFYWRGLRIVSSPIRAKIDQFHCRHCKPTTFFWEVLKSNSSKKRENAFQIFTLTGAKNNFRKQTISFLIFPVEAFLNSFGICFLLETIYNFFLNSFSICFL